MDKIVFIKKGQPQTTSRLVAMKFGKEHKHILEAIRNLECSEEFNRSNFRLVDYVDQKGERRPEYYITRDGFTFLVMGFTGKQAAAFKEEYIMAFNRMERRELKPRSSEELILDQARALVSHQRRMSKLESKVKELEAKTTTRVEDYYTIAGYASKIGKPVSIQEASGLGKRASTICNKNGITVDKINDPRFGYVGSYPERVLRQLFVPQ